MIPYKGIDEESYLRPQPTYLDLPYGARLRSSVFRSYNARLWLVSLCTIVLLLIVISNMSVSYQEIVELETYRILHHTNERFLSVALDSSLIQERWHHLNISSPKFLLMAKLLSPGYLRIGGTMADRLIFSANATVQPEVVSNYVDHQLQMKNLNSEHTDQSNETVYGIMDGDIWSYSSGVNIKHLSNFTMTGDEWISINNFATNAGLKILFDLNVLIRDGEKWNNSNALELIKFSDEHGFDIDWQLGNEPNSFRHVFNVSITGAQLGKDFTELKTILKSFPRYNNSLLVGPDVTRPTVPQDPALRYLKEFLENVNDSINAVTWHQYYLNGHTAHLEDITPESLNVLYEQIDRVKTVVHNVYNRNNSPPIWLSETGSAYGGGAGGLSDSFAAGFLWLDKLGVAAREGIDVVVRQSLYHGYYSLLEEKTLNPLPDWWLTVIYKTFVGTKVIRATSLLGSVRIYCHCTPSKTTFSPNGTVTVFGMNMFFNEAVVQLEGLPLRSQHMQVHQYILTGENELSSKSVLLNGVKLEMNPDGSLPPFKPSIVTTRSEVSLPPYSLAFFVLHGVNVPACAEVAYY